MKHTNKIIIGLFVAAFLFCLSLELAQAKYIGGDYRKCEECEECKNRETCPTGHCSLDITQGAMSEQYGVASMGVATIDFSLVYSSENADNSRAQIDSGMGYGWTHSYNTFLFSQRGHMFRMDGNGMVTRFQRGGGGTFTATVGFFETMRWNYNDRYDPNDDIYTITRKDGTIHTFVTIADTPFMVAGPVWRLASITDRSGNFTDLAYTNGDLTSITDNFGRSLTLEYLDHKLVSITAPVNRTTTLAYDATGRKLESITGPDNKAVRYTYNFLYQMTSKIDKKDLQTTFHYSNLKPVGAEDDNGESMFHLSNPTDWATDDLALARTQMREYVPSTTTRKDGRGNLWLYEYDKHGHVAKIVAPDGAVTTFAYDPSTLKLASTTDANGHTSTYEYDSLGNLVSETDALGYQTVHEYSDSDCSDKVTKTTKPNGSTTEYEYDTECNMVKETRDAGGLDLTTQWTYIYPGGLVRTETDPNNHTTTYEYDAYGNQAKVIEPEDCVTEYGYDKPGMPEYAALGLRTKMIDGNGNITSYEYDGMDRLIKETDPLGFVIEYEYDGNDNQIEVKKQVSKAPGTETYQITRTEYDLRNRLIREIRDPGGLNLVTEYNYDGNGNRVRIVDPQSNVAVFDYDSQNRLSLVTDALSNATETRYDGVGNRICRIDANGHHTFYEYDPLNRLVKMSRKIGNQECATGDANDIITRYFYDPPGGGGCSSCAGPTPGTSNIAQIIDPEEKVTCFKYDAADRLTATIRKVADTDCSVADGDDWLETTEYDAVGNVLASIDANANATTFEYYDNNRLKKEINAESEPTGYTYDCAGNAITVAAPNGNVTTNTYNARNELVGATDLVGKVAAYEYDGAGNPIREQSAVDDDGDGTDNEKHFFYDNANRLIAAIDPTGQTTGYGYDPNGNLIKVTDRENNVTCHIYDAINRRIRTTRLMGGGGNCALLDSDDIWTDTDYDPAGNVARLITAKNGATPGQCRSGTPPDDCEITVYEYDEADRLIREIYPDPSPNERFFNYDKAGNIQARTDQMGRTTTFFYNDLYYLTRRDYATESDDVFDYDTGGRMKSAEKGDWLVTFDDYDGVNRLEQTTQNGQIVRYAYDIALGKRTIFYPGGRAVTEFTDLRGRLGTVDRGPGPAFPITPLAFYNYDLDNRVLTRRYENGVEALYEYNANNWIIRLDHAIGPTRIAGFAYDYDREGNKKYEHWLHKSTPTLNSGESYEYDDIYRLVDYKAGELDVVLSTVTVPTTQTRYDLDKAGNWDQKEKDGVVETRTHNRVNELTAIDGLPLDYDDSGNIVEDDRYEYAYDEENRLLAVTRKADAWLVGQYQYDALGRRVVKIAYPDPSGVPVETQYFYDDARVIEEQDVAEATEATFAYGPNIDEVLNMAREVGGATDDYYYHQNALGSVMAVTDELGAMAEHYEYDAYGRVLAFDSIGNPVSPNVWGNAHSTIDNPYMFTGRRFDEETGLFYYRARYYSCDKGRFFQRDPWEYADGMNLYIYVGNNPSNWTDPNGRKKFKACDRLVKGKKRCGVSKFEVTWAKNPTAGPTKAELRLDITIDFKMDAKHDPCCCEYRQNVKTVAKVTDGPRKGQKVDTSPLHDDNYSRADDTDGNGALGHPGFTTNDNPGLPNINATDVIDYAFTAEQGVIDCCDKSKEIARKGPHTATIKGKHPRMYGGVPKKL